MSAQVLIIWLCFLRISFLESKCKCKVFWKVKYFICCCVFHSDCNIKISVCLPVHLGQVSPVIVCLLVPRVFKVYHHFKSCLSINNGDYCDHDSHNCARVWSYTACSSNLKSNAFSKYIKLFKSFTHIETAFLCFQLHFFNLLFRNNHHKKHKNYGVLGFWGF